MSVSNPVLKKAAAFSKRCFRLICEYFSAGLHRDVPLSKKKRRLFRFFTFFLFVAAIAIFLTVFTIQVHNTGSREAVFKENAGIVCTDIISELGTSRIEQLYDEETENSWRMLGISTVRRIDFNADGRDELLLVYFKGGMYITEVWGNSGKEFEKYFQQEACVLDDYSDLGSWLTIYNSGGQYYIGRLNADENENMDLLALHGKEFKADRACRFEPTEGIYLVDEKVDSSNFETIQFSALTSARAEYQLNDVQTSLSQFVSETRNVDDKPKTDAQKKASAFSKVIDNKVQKYGSPQISQTGSIFFADGMAAASLIDFNGDGNEELLLISRNKSDYHDTDASPRYVTEVFAWNNEAVVKIYEGNTASTYFDDTKRDVFYILQKKDSKTKLCFNSYFYGENPEISWRAVSTICEMTANDKFETTFTALKRKNYDYISYKINGDYAGKSEFEKKGYTVPYFCSEDDYNKDEFAVTVLKGDESRKAEIEQVIADTEKTIKQIIDGSAFSE